MGKSASKSHEEYDRNSIKCRGFVEKYSFKRGETKRRYFTLNKTTLGYSLSKEMQVIPIQPFHIVNIDKNFKILCDDLDRKEISIECVNQRGENSLWKLIFSTKENADKWAKKLKKAVRPEWEDPSVKFCNVCSKPFMLFRRQHHCRKCGKVICSMHYKYTKNLLELGYTSKVKVCVNCINRIGNVNGVQRANSLGEKEAERTSVMKYNSVRMSPSSSVLDLN